MSDRYALGNLGEQMACEALSRRGYTIVERRWRCARGEVDIVARDGACWVFVEVKTRRGRGAGLPEEAVTRRKAQRMTELAELYLAEHSLGNVDWRLDLVAIELGAGERVQRLEVVPCITAD